MQITDIRVRLMPNNGRLKAFCAVTLDNEFAVKDLKIVEGNSGLFVAMPSRKLEDRCGKCGGKNHLRARFCNECGAKLAENRTVQDEHGKPKLNIDIAHPIDAHCRQRCEQQILEAFHKELETAKQPSYKPKPEDDPIAQAEFQD